MSNKLFSKLELNNLLVDIYLGWTAAERSKKQSIFLDLIIKFPDLPQACFSDELEDTLCYDSLTQDIKKFATTKSFRLIEFFAHELYELLQKKLPRDTEIVLQVKKPKPCADLEFSSFTISDFTENN